VPAGHAANVKNNGRAPSSISQISSFATLEIGLARLSVPPPRGRGSDRRWCSTGSIGVRPEMVIAVSYVEWHRTGRFGMSSIWGITAGMCRAGSWFAIVVQAAPVLAILVACNLLIPKASSQDGAPLSLVARPMYLLGSGQLVPRLFDNEPF